MQITGELVQYLEKLGADSTDARAGASNGKGFAGDFILYGNAQCPGHRRG